MEEDDIFRRFGIDGLVEKRCGGRRVRRVLSARIVSGMMRIESGLNDTCCDGLVFFGIE